MDITFQGYEVENKHKASNNISYFDIPSIDSGDEDLCVMELVPFDIREVAAQLELRCIGGS